jgi:hypothetical protein
MNLGIGDVIFIGVGIVLILTLGWWGVGLTAAYFLGEIVMSARIVYRATRNRELSRALARSRYR